MNTIIDIIVLLAKSLLMLIIKQVFLGLVSFSGSLAIKCVSLNNESCMARATQ